MEYENKTRETLTAHYRKYPQMQIQDLFKLLHQSAFGCEHMVSSEKDATAYIAEESKTVLSNSDTLVDRLDGAYSRVHLSYLRQGLSAATLGRMFYLSAKNEENGLLSLEKKLDITKELIKEKTLPFSLAEFESVAAKWKACGYTPLHHSEIFRKNYNPSYRVTANKYIPFLPLFARIDKLLKKGSAVIAIEGGSASGKTTLSKMLEEIYGCTVLHMDDFFLQPEQRTAERFAEPGGNIDRERFLQEVLVPLSKNEQLEYRRFDCSTMKILPAVSIVPQKLTVIEGAYSMHPELEKYYDLSVFLDIPQELQKERISKRNTPQMAERFYNEWIPLESKYFQKLNVKQRCSLTIEITNHS